MVNVNINFDMEKCIGCKACQVACKDKNNLPPGDFFIKIREKEQDSKTYYECIRCDHCNTSPCRQACKARAIKQEAQFGAIIIDAQSCTACGLCLSACPKHMPVRDETNKQMQKCHLCIDELQNQRLPSCIEACQTDALEIKMSCKIA